MNIQPGESRAKFTVNAAERSRGNKEIGGFPIETLNYGLCPSLSRRSSSMALVIGRKDERYRSLAIEI